MLGCRTQQRYTGATCLLHSGHDGDHVFPATVESRKTQRRKRNSTEFKVASMLAMILDERDDNPEDPGEIRMEQARKLLTNWSSAQSSLIGAFWEILNLQAGHCVRCEERPCPVCGRASDFEPLTFPWDRL